MKPFAGLKITLPFVLALLGLMFLGALSYQNLAAQKNKEEQKQS